MTPFAKAISELPAGYEAKWRSLCGDGVLFVHADCRRPVLHVSNEGKVTEFERDEEVEQ